jgi:hypothetical protein
MARATNRGGSARSRFQIDEARPETGASVDGFRPLVASFALMDGKWAKNELLVILRSEAGNSKPSKIWLYPFPERVMTHVCKSSSARHREQEQGADFVHVGCFHPSILRHFQFFPIQPMISTGFPASPVVPSWTSGIYAGFHLISLRPDEINPPGHPSGRFLLRRSRGPDD